LGLLTVVVSCGLGAVVIADDDRGCVCHTDHHRPDTALPAVT
jgi:hypothetical protein